MVGFKGRSSLKQYVPKNSPSKVLKCGVGVTVRLDTFVLFRLILKKLGIVHSRQKLLIVFNKLLSSHTLLADLVDSKIYCSDSIGY